MLTIIGEEKFTLPVGTISGNGDLWSVPQPIGPYPSCLVSIVKSGSISAGVITVYTGANSSSLLAADDAANPIDAHTASVQKRINNLDKFLQLTMSSWTGTGSLAVTVTCLGMRAV